MDNKNIVLETFSERTRLTRFQKRITQRQLAQMAGISVSVIMSYEKINPTTPSIVSAAKIAQALNVSLDYLCGIDEKEKTAGAAIPNGQ